MMSINQFKMGLSKTSKPYKRIETALGQTIRLGDKVIKTDVDYVYSHNDGDLTGTVRINGKHVSVKRITISKSTQRKTIHGMVDHTVILGHYWSIVK